MIGIGAAKRVCESICDGSQAAENPSKPNSQLNAESYKQAYQNEKRPESKREDQNVWSLPRCGHGWECGDVWAGRSHG